MAFGKTQQWFTCLDFADITKRYGEYARGNCYRTRRVVLDAHQQPDSESLHISSPTELLADFKNYFRQECASALANNEPILLSVFAHGEEFEYGLEIGGMGEQGDLLTVKAMREILQDFDGVKVTMLMTSCFSGGWSITPDLWDETGRSRITVMRSQQVSESWPKTTTLGRADGSIYISSILNVLASRRPQTGEELDEKPIDTKEFSNLITSELLDIVDPRFGDSHGHSFNVQNDQWEELYTTRTGIPLIYYSARLDLLREIPPRPLVDARLDRSSASDEVEAWEDAHGASGPLVMAASNYGGSMRAVRKAITNQAIAYRKGFPGRDSLATNLRPHGLIDKCIQSPHLLEDGAWQRIWEILHYRIGSMSLAEKFVRRLGIRAPRPCTWDKDEWLVNHRQSKLGDKASAFYRTVFDSGLIPPAPNSYNRYDKALWYIAVMCAESGLPEPDVQTGLANAGKSKLFVFRLHQWCAKLSLSC